MGDYVKVKPREFRGMVNRARVVFVHVDYGPGGRAFLEVPVSRPTAKQIAEDAEEEGSTITVRVDKGGKEITIGPDYDDLPEEEVNPATGEAVELAAEDEEEETEANEDEEE